MLHDPTSLTDINSPVKQASGHLDRRDFPILNNRYTTVTDSIDSRTGKNMTTKQNAKQVEEELTSFR